MGGTSSFGTWLRRRRKALGLTRQELARRAACAAVTIEKIEIGERRPSADVALALANGLRIPPAEREAFVDFARGHATAPDSSVPHLRLIPNNLPADLPALIGRERDADDLLRRLLRADGQLLTLAGPGGVGKTALALHVAERCACAAAAQAERIPFQDGVAFVDLAPIREPGLVVSAIARALTALDDLDGIATSEPTLASLAERLREKSMLIVLDNFEHVLPAAQPMTKLLEACPRVCLLITSRERLSCAGELVVTLSPLSSASAVSLFVERAQAASPRFKPTREAMPAIESLCRHLDGLPLAIELVAARVKVMTPQALLERLVDPAEHLQLGLVTAGASGLPVRQRTLREAIAWSYRLLTRDEQRLFCRLSAFVGGFDLMAVEHVVMERRDAERSTVVAWDALASLLDKSLLVRNEVESGEPRFTMLETLREFAQACLRVAGEHRTFELHARYYHTIALEAEPHLYEPSPLLWHRRLALEQGNLRAALDWELQHDAPAALRMCVALAPLWHTTGAWREGRGRLEAALAAAGGDAPTRAGALYWLGRIARRMNDPEAALRYAEESVDAYQELDDPPRLARATMALGWARYSRHGCAAATVCFERGLAMYRALGDARGIAQALLDLAHMAREQHADLDRAARYLGESRMLFRMNGDEEGQGYVAWGLALIASLRGDYARCRELSLEAMNIFERIGAKGVVAGGYESLGETSYLTGDYAAAEDELTRALQLHREVGSASGAAIAQHHLARLRRKQGRLAEAAEMLVAALGTFCRLRKEGMMARCVAALGGVALARGCPERAAVLLGAAQRYFDGRPAFLAPADVAEYDADIAASRASLGDDAFRAAWAAGQAMSLAEACDRALMVFDAQHG